MSTLTDKQLTKLKLSADLNEVTIEFTDTITNHTAAEDEEGIDREEKIQNFYKVVGARRPHKNLSDSMKSLRKHALALCGIEVSSKHIGDWTVSEISITGDMTLRQSRCIMKLAKECPTGKVVEFKVPQVTMYPIQDEEQRYHDAEKMSVTIEDIVEEAWAYLAGRYETEVSGQLPLMFAIEPKLETNFTQ